jgi:outer membrane usher protein
MGDFVHLYCDPEGRWYATADMLKQARLLRPLGQPFRIKGGEFYPMDSYRDVTYRFDATQQLLSIIVPATNFQSQMFQASKRIAAPAMTSSPGLFMNHDFQITGSNTQVQVGGEEEFGFFSKLGVLTSQFAARDLTSHWAATRLQTEFFRDFPSRMATLGLGDHYSATFASWTQTVNYAGVRWASNFTTQPAFLPFALPAIAGRAAQPSTVDLYVNNLKTMQQPVDEGPFTISDIPVMSAEGNIQMVVTDMLGRQQIVSLPYISTRQLLRARVSEYTFESGVQRRNFGLESNGYGGWFGAGTYRRGLTNTFTLGLRGEALLDSQTGGIGFDAGFLHLGVVSGGIAASHDKSGQSGGLAYAQVQRNARAFGFSLYAQAAQEHFRQLGLLPGQQPTQFLGQAQASYALGRWVTVAAGYMHQEKPTYAVNDAHGKPVPRFNTVTPSLNIRLPHGAELSVSGNYTPEFHQKASAMISLIIPLKKRRMVTASTGYQAGGTNPAVDYSQTLPPGTGWGYRLRTSSSDNLKKPRIDAGVSYQNDLGLYQLEASQQWGQQVNWLFNYTGSAALLHGDALLSRQLTDGFAVVDANGAPGVKVLANNSFVATTDRRGLAIVPSLPSYNRNLISLDQNSVPLDVDVDLSERIVVPMARSGLLVKFKAEPVQGALLALVAEDGKELPVGAEVSVIGDKEVYEVALHGEAFIPVLQFPADIHVHWDGVKCQATVAKPESKDPLPRIGPITCRRIP